MKNECKNTDLVFPILDRLILENATVNSASNSDTFYVGSAKHADCLIYLGGETGTATIQFHVDVIEPSSGQVIRTYDGTEMTAVGADYITIDGLTLGTAIRVSWDAGTGTLDASNYFTGVYCRLVAKR